MDSYKLIDSVYVYFVTFTISDWLPIFVNPEPVRIVFESLEYCIKEKDLRIHAYVIMPNHAHLVVFDANFDNDHLEKTLTDFRKFTGHKLAVYIDGNMTDSIAAVIRSKQLVDRKRQVWQPGWHAEALASEAFLLQKVNYIHENPVRKGYVRSAVHWLHSSAAYWINGQKPEIPLSAIGQDDSTAL